MKRLFFSTLTLLLLWVLPYLLLAIPTAQQYACELVASLVAKAGGELSVAAVQWDLRGGISIQSKTLGYAGETYARDVEISGRLAWSQLIQCACAGELPLWLEVHHSDLTLTPMLLVYRILPGIEHQLTISGMHEGSATAFQLKLKPDSHRWLLDCCMETQLMEQRIAVAAQVDLHRGVVAAMLSVAEHRSSWSATYSRDITGWSFEGWSDAMNRQWLGTLARDGCGYRLMVERCAGGHFEAHTRLGDSPRSIAVDWQFTHDTMALLGSAGATLDGSGCTISSSIREANFPGVFESALVIDKQLGWWFTGVAKEFSESVLTVEGAGQGGDGHLSFRAQLSDIAQWKLPQLAAGALSLEGSADIINCQISELTTQIDCHKLKLITAPADLDCDYQLAAGFKDGKLQIKGVTTLNVARVIPSQLVALGGFNMVQQAQSSWLHPLLSEIELDLDVRCAPESRLCIGDKTLELIGSYHLQGQLLAQDRLALHLFSPITYCAGHELYDIEAMLQGSLAAPTDISCLMVAQTQLADTELLLTLQGTPLASTLQLFSHPYMSASELLKQLQDIDMTKAHPNLQQSLKQAVSMLPKAKPHVIQNIKYACGLHHCEIWPTKPLPWTPCLSLDLGPNLMDRLTVQLYEQVNRERQHSKSSATPTSPATSRT